VLPFGISGPKVYGLPYRHSIRGQKPADKQKASEERAVRIAYKRDSKSLICVFELRGSIRGFTRAGRLLMQGGLPRRGWGRETNLRSRFH